MVGSWLEAGGRRQEAVDGLAHHSFSEGGLTALPTVPHMRDSEGELTVRMNWESDLRNCFKLCALSFALYALRRILIPHLRD